MKWFMNNGKENDIVVSTRIRLARNLEEFPFPSKLSAESGEEVVKKIKNVLENNYAERLNFLDMQSKTPAELEYMFEEHMISKEFCSKSIYPKCLITNEQGNLAIMVNEEDHLRIQSILPGFALDEAYEMAKGAGQAIEKSIAFAYDKNLGYLTSCPTNLGTGLRASVMVHIPCLYKKGYLKALSLSLTKLGLTVRGFFGEGSDGYGSFFQISNQITLGFSEKDTLEKLQSAVTQIVEKEKALRNAMSKDIEFEDMLCRSVGILKSARKMSFNEALKLISDALLCKGCGFTEELLNINLVKLMINVMPGHLVCQDENLYNDTLKRDTFRANYIRQQFKTE